MDCGQSAHVLVVSLGYEIASAIETTRMIEIGLSDDYLGVSGTLSDLVSWSICVFSGQASVIYYYLPIRNGYRGRMCYSGYGCHGLGGFYFGRVIALVSCNEAENGFRLDAEVD